MEIVEGRKKCCLVEMRMIDADTECCSKIMVIGSRMSSFVEKGEKKKKNYISSGSSIFISTVCNVSLTSSLIRCIHFVVDRTIAHSTPPPLSCLFVFVSNSRVVWCGFRTDGKRRGKKKKKDERTKKKNNTREGGRQCFSFVDTTIVEWTWKPDSICQVELILNQFEHWFATEWMMDRLPSQPWIPERARVMRFYSCRFDSTRRKLESLIGRARLRRIWVATGKKIEESVQGKIIESDSIIVEITQLDTKGERGGDNAIMKTRGEI